MFASLSNNWNQLADDLRHAGDIPLSSFLIVADLEPEELYSNDSRTFTEFRHQAGFRKESLPNTELTRAISRLMYVDDEVRLQQWAAWLATRTSPCIGRLESINADDVLGPWLRETAGNRNVASVR